MQKNFELDQLLNQGQVVRENAGLIAVIAFCWSLFQLYTASTLPFTLTEWLGINVTFNLNESRAIHLAFALCIGSLMTPNICTTSFNKLVELAHCLGHHVANAVSTSLQK